MNTMSRCENPRRMDKSTRANKASALSSLVNKKQSLERKDNDRYVAFLCFYTAEVYKNLPGFTVATRLQPRKLTSVFV